MTLLLLQHTPIPDDADSADTLEVGECEEEFTPVEKMHDAEDDFLLVDEMPDAPDSQVVSACPCRYDNPDATPSAMSTRSRGVSGPPSVRFGASPVGPRSLSARDPASMNSSAIAMG